MACTETIPILTYHSIDASGSVVSTSRERFTRQMAQLAESSAMVVPLSMVVDCITSRGSVPPGCVAITFDDGFANFLEHAYPVLREHGFPATVFMVPGRCGGDNRWAGQPDDIPTLELLSWSQVELLATDGIDLGAHTMTHPDLTVIGADEAEREIVESACAIEEKTGRKVEHFAYPYGRFSPEVREVVSNRYRSASSTEMGFARAGSDPYALPRIDMYYFSTNNMFRWINTPLFTSYVRCRSTLRSIRSGIS